MIRCLSSQKQRGNSRQYSQGRVVCWVRNNGENNNVIDNNGENCLKTKKYFLGLDTSPSEPKNVCHIN